MELTAINIPGKQKRDNGKAAVAARKALKRPPGRPFKPSDLNEETLSSASSEAVSKKSRKKSLKNIKSRRKMSYLEKLPTEILETIFLFCLNLDLPMSSPVIAGKLSSPIVYNKIVLAAFGPTWERWHGRDRNRMQKSGDAGLGDSEQDPVLQSAILRCRWATLPAILNAKETWIQRYAKDRPFNPAWFVRNSNTHSEDDDEEEEEPPRLTAQEYLGTDFQGFSNLILGHRDGGWLWDECSWGVNSDVADGVEIPESLLSGPWTEDMLQYLFWVGKSGALIDWYNSTSGEVALDGFKKAIMFGDVRAIHILAWTGIVDKLDVDLLLWAFRNVGGDKLAVINQLLRLNFGVMRDREALRINNKLAEMMDEAKQEDDEVKLEFVRNILTSETLHGRLETFGGSVRTF